MQDMRPEAMTTAELQASILEHVRRLDERVARLERLSYDARPQEPLPARPAGPVPHESQEAHPAQ